MLSQTNLIAPSSSCSYSHCPVSDSDEASPCSKQLTRAFPCVTRVLAWQPRNRCRLLRVGVALLVLVVAYSFCSDPLSALWPATRPSAPICQPLSSAFTEWLKRHRHLRYMMENDCEAAWNTTSPPRILVHTCNEVCSGLGDRVAKAAGLFLFALLTDRSLFLDHTYPVMSEWWGPTANFDWKVSGKVRECLEFGRQLGATQRFASTPVHESRWDEDYWGWYNGWRGAVRKTFLPSAITIPSAPALYTDAPANLIRPLEIASEFRHDFDLAVSKGLAPAPLHTDDTLASLLTGCLLSELWQPTNRTNALVAPLKAQASGCLVAIHIRWGDRFMFHFNASTLEGTETDRHIEPQPLVVEESLRCAVTQAHDACSNEEKANGLSIFFTTDAPQYSRWFDIALPELRRWDSHQWRSAAFPMIKLLKSPWEKPGNVVSFSKISPEELHEAEKQLMSDWTMLAQATVTVTTGSIFSYTAAANGLCFPIDSRSCAVRWFK